ncbi:MAG: hypothetical protein DDT23_00996 [candidate division WS2 bacterium]|nr:hypothetical protein [Candidatus Lithacetigena glycinireducens]
MYLIYRAQNALTILIFAFIIAYLFQPLVNFLEKRRIPRILGVIVVYFLIFLVIGTASVLLAEVVVQLSRFAVDLPTILKPLLSWIQNLPDRILLIPIPSGMEEIFNQASLAFKNILEGFTGSLLLWIKSLLEHGGKIIVVLVGGLFQLVTSLLLGAYLLYDLPRIGKSILKAFPEVYQPKVTELAKKADKAVGSYARGQVLVAIIVGLIVGIGLGIIGIPLATTMGFLAGLFNLIPFVGVIVSSIPALLLALTGGWLSVILTMGILVLANQMEVQFLNPIIVGKAINIHPATAILAILAGVEILGLWGALLALPTMAILKMLYTDYYQKSKFYKEG